MSQQPTLRIGHLSTFYHTAILLMARGDADKGLGQEIHWRLMGTGPAIMKAFREGELDLAYIGLPPAIIGIAQGDRVICVAGGHMEGTVMAGKSEWRGIEEYSDTRTVMQQFRGRAIGVPGTGSIHDIILKNCLREYGLERDIKVRNYAWADLVTEAVVNDEVSAAFGTPALATAIRRFAGGRVLIPPARLWPDNPSYGILVSLEYLEKSRETVERFIAMHEDAAEFLRKEPIEAARLIAGYVGIIDEEFVLDTLRLSPRYCANLTKEYMASTMRFVPVMRELGYLGTIVEQDRIFYPEIVNAILEGADHYGRT